MAAPCVPISASSSLEPNPVVVGRPCSKSGSSCSHSSVALRLAKGVGIPRISSRQVPSRVQPAFGESLSQVPDEVLQTICQVLPRRDWQIFALTSRANFNSIAMQTPLEGDAEQAQDVQIPVMSTAPAIYPDEIRALVFFAIVFWLLIFFGGRAEWQHGVERDCTDFCAECGAGDLSYRSVGCRRCQPGYINGGMKCVERLEDLKPVRTGAALGGAFYYYAIIVVQVAGATIEILLLTRLRRRGLIVGKEIFVALSALFVEIVRMALVDLFMLRTYFFGHDYKFFGLDPHGAFVGLRNATAPAASQYIVAWAHLSARELDVGTCSIFDRSSPLLDYDESFGWGTGGHPRFRTIGWVIGGEFAMYYFFAAVVNELADVLFVIPVATLRYGFKCKIASVILELFQLGALFPAAAFTHGRCLLYHDPLGADLNVIRYTIVYWGYFIWGSVFIIGLVVGIVAGLHLALFSNGCPGFILRRLPRCRSQACQPCRTVFRTCVAFTERLGASALEAYLFIASFPLLVTGACLGLLVCMGQASKESPAEIITAVVLLSDVLLKLSLFGCVEATDEALRRDVRKKEAARQRRLADVRRQAELGGGAIAFPEWWERPSRSQDHPTRGFRGRLWRALHA